MKNRLLNYIICPICKSDLSLISWKMDANGEVLDGILRCRSRDHWYPIINGVPRLIRPELWLGSKFGEWMDLFNENIASSRINLRYKPIVKDQSRNLSQDISEKFGFEWKQYSQFGWNDNDFNLAKEEAVFRWKTSLSQEDMEGKLALDAGCGNGRYSYWANQYGSEVIGVEIGEAVDAAFSNTHLLPKVHIIQADIFELPFRPSTFDVIFSIGVLQHTGNARGAFAELAKQLKPGGSLSIIVYGKGNRIYEWAVGALRSKTTKMDIPQLLSFTKHVYRITKILATFRILRIVRRFIDLQNHPHLIFNRYSAPTATTHTFNEVRSWYAENNINITNNNENMHGIFYKNNWLRAASSIAVRGVKPAYSNL